MRTQINGLVTLAGFARDGIFSSFSNYTGESNCYKCIVLRFSEFAEVFLSVIWFKEINLFVSSSYKWMRIVQAVNCTCGDLCLSVRQRMHRVN